MEHLSTVHLVETIAEILQFLGCQPLLELVHRHALLREQLSVDVADMARHDVIYHHAVVAHVQRLPHHAVHLAALAHRRADAQRGQTVQQEDEDAQHDEPAQNIERDGGGIVVDALGVEPLVVNLLQLAGLLQPRVLVVDDVDERLVVADDAQLARRDVYAVHREAVEAQLLDLELQRHLAPYEISSLALPYPLQRALGRAVFLLEGAVHIPHAQLGIVVLLEDERGFLRQVGQTEQWRSADLAHYAHIIVVDILLGHHIRRMIIVIRQRVDEVGLAMVEHLHGHIPLLHHKLVRNAQPVEYQVEHFDVITVGHALRVQEFERRKVPVAYDDQGMLLGESKGVLGRQRSGGCQRP